jgi:ketosteroid isomerase-like protein
VGSTIPAAGLGDDRAEARFPGLVTDDQGAGSLTATYRSGLGEHVLNVNVVASSDGSGQEDPRPREIGPDSFADVTVPGVAVSQTLYGDGDIHCPDHWAHELSLPVGQVRYRPTSNGLEITVTLEQAWPNTEYYVRVNSDTFCDYFPFTAAEGAVIEDYVRAWNAQDVDAIVAMHSIRDKGSSAEQIRCEYEVAFQEDLRLTVDFDQNTYEITNAAGAVVPPFDDPHYLTLEVFHFAGDGGFLGASIPIDISYQAGPDSQMWAAMERCYVEDDSMDDAE